MSSEDGLKGNMEEISKGGKMKYVEFENHENMIYKNVDSLIIKVMYHHEFR